MLSGRSRLERGEAARIARELSCSREGVRLAMIQLGVTIKAPPGPPSCTGCGKAMMYRKTRICQSCRHERLLVSLKCVNCGRAFERRRSRHEAFLRRTVSQRRHGPVCSRQCSAKIPWSCSWCGQPAGTRWRADAGWQAFCRPPRSCRIQAQTTFPPVWWRYLTDVLLPMKDHQDRIAQLRATLTSKPVNPQ